MNFRDSRPDRAFKDIVMHRQKQGFTIIEVLVAIAVFTLVMLFIIPVFSYSRRATTTMTRLDSYHDVRRVDQEIASEIKFGSAILYPPKPSGSNAGEWHSQIVYRNSLNQTQVIFVNEKNQLVLLNYDSLLGPYLSGARTLGSSIKEFLTRRHGNSVIEYKLCFEADQREFAVTNRIALMNVF